MINNELLEKNYGGERCPEELDCTLDLQMANANCCKFNRWGTLVAVGATDGRVFIVDFLTKGVVKQFQAHVLPVSSLSWSRDGRLLLTSSADCMCIVWDVLSAQKVTKFKYSAMILSAMFNPRKETQLLVHPNGFHPSVECTDPRSTRIVSTDNPIVSDDTVSCASFDRKGKHIITGTTKGRIVIYDAETLKLLAIVKQNSAQQIRNIIIPKRGSSILTNSQDRVIRRYDLDELVRSNRGLQVEPIQKLSDIVNKAAWKAVCCSSDGEYICGASTKAHSLYLWERASGSLIKILHGAKGESLLDVQWHPSRSVILSVANGTVSVWTQAHVENWSAFAPEFTELEENTKYVEKEGEFDVEDEDAEQEEKGNDEEKEEMEIDVVNIRSSDTQCSSDEEETLLSAIPSASGGPLWFIPVTPEIEVTENTTQIAPHADINFLKQPPGGASLHYDDPNDLRLRTTATAAASVSKNIVKASRRPTK